MNVNRCKSIYTVNMTARIWPIYPHLSTMWQLLAASREENQQSESSAGGYSMCAKDVDGIHWKHCVEVSINKTVLRSFETALAFFQVMFMVSIVYMHT